MLTYAAGIGTAVLVRSIRQNRSSHEYPLLARRVQNNDRGNYRVNFTSLRSELQEYVDSHQEKSGDISVYFESLATGSSIHLAEDTEYIAASLMKVPIVMSLYRWADETGADLDKKVALKEEWLNNEYGTLYQKGAGYELTIREAARLTLSDSDNTALSLVHAQMDSRFIEGADGVISFMDFSFEVTEDLLALVDTKNYSSILKCLYFACYNSLEDSQEILGYLTESSYDERLMLYLPDGITVAHKIGTFNDDYQSDCGIFYLSEYRNYILCVMVKEQDPDASYIIADISQMVYLHMKDSVEIEADSTID